MLMPHLGVAIREPRMTRVESVFLVPGFCVALNSVAGYATPFPLYRLLRKRGKGIKQAEMFVS